MVMSIFSSLSFYALWFMLLVLTVSVLMYYSSL